jgi:hypothetical protein
LSRRTHRWSGVWAVVLAALLATTAAAQPQLMGRGGLPTFTGARPEPEPDLSITSSNVGIIDPAVPFTMARLRYDNGLHNLRPVRAEFFQPKPAVLGGRGQLFPETKASYQDFTTYGELAWLPFFSTFVEVPYRWLNPDINDNTNGYSDVSYGFKLCTWSSDALLATLQFRLYNPTGDDGLGSGHWTAEPALLGAYRISDAWLLEGEVRYVVPLNGSDFAGDVLRYGLGISFGERQPGFWWAPVLEGVGWSVMGGQSLVALSRTNYFIEDAEGQTIVNGYLGVRLGIGHHLDGYVGYGRCLTGHAWQRDFVRVEMRLIY